MRKTSVLFFIIFMVFLAAAPGLRSEVTASLTVVDPSSGRGIIGPLSYRGPCPVTLKFVGRLGSSESRQIQYRFVRSNGITTPVVSITVQAGRSRAVETTWTLSGPFAGWMEIEILSPLSLKSNRVEFKVECAAAPTLKTPPVVGTAGPQTQEAAPSARPSGKAIPKTSSGSGDRPSGKAVAKASPPDPHKPTFFVANDQSGKVTIFDRTGTRIRTIEARYTNGDGFGVGDVNGDGADEIVIAGDVHGRVNIYRLNGERIGDFDGRFTKRDGLAVGDVNGDRRAEIIIAGDKNGIIDIFTWTGQKLRSFYGGFTKNDALDAGDVDGDGIDEILHHGDYRGRVNAYNFQGGKVAAFPSTLNAQRDAPRDSGIGAGDVDGDRLSEIVVAFDAGYDKNLLTTEFRIHRTIIYDTSGRELKDFAAFTLGDTMRVGDVTGDGMADIVIAGDTHHSVHVYNKEGVQLMTFIAGYTKNDGFAIARR